MPEENLPASAAAILIVDDTPAYLRILGTMLRRYGYAVRTAPSAQAAWAAVEAALPDLILLDVKMPGTNGYALCERLKAGTGTRDIPVIFISGADDIADKLRAFTCGGVDYIAKPFHDEEVLARVRTQLALRSLQKRLEELLRERTAELVEADAQVRGGIVERLRAEDRFRGVLESAPEAMLVVDARRHIAFVNSQAEALFGYRRDELLGGAVEMLMPERFRHPHALFGTDYLAQPHVRPMGKGRGLLGLHKDGREFPAEISLSPLAGDDRTLVICTIRDISERMQIEQELIASRQKLRELAAHHDAVREMERKRIAGEIHDELGALLTALKMDISLLRMRVGENPDLQQRVGQMRELVEQTIQGVRQVATQLRPAALNLGIVPALEWLVADFGRHTASACSLDACCEIEMGDAQATAVFRIVQESLTNVARHAGANTVTVILARSDHGVEVRIRDDGCGFDAQVLRGGTFGLLGLRERALVLGATLRIDSAPGRGTLIALTIPEAP